MKHKWLVVLAVIIVVAVAGLTYNVLKPHTVQEDTAQNQQVFNFDPTTINVGDKVGKFTLSSIKPASDRLGTAVTTENFIAEFTGEAEVRGTYNYNPASAGIEGGSGLGFTVDNISANDLPRRVEKSETLLEFKNLDEAKSKLSIGKEQVTGEKTILISGYTLVSYPAGGVPVTTTLVQVK